MNGKEMPGSPYNGVSLASIEGFGQVYDCGNCGNLHVQIGPMSITLDPHAYMQLVDLMSTSAANFELWMQRRVQQRSSEQTQLERDQKEGS